MWENKWLREHTKDGDILYIVILYYPCLLNGDNSKTKVCFRHLPGRFLYYNIIGIKNAFFRKIQFVAGMKMIRIDNSQLTNSIVEKVVGRNKNASFTMTKAIAMRQNSRSNT